MTITRFKNAMRLTFEKPIESLKQICENRFVTILTTENQSERTRLFNIFTGVFNLSSSPQQIFLSVPGNIKLTSKNLRFF